MKTSKCSKYKGKAVMLIAALLVISLFAGCGELSTKEKKLKTVKKGSWVSVMKKSKADKKNHSVKVRVKKIIRNQKEVKKLIEEHNLISSQNKVKLDLNNDKLEFCIAKYDVKFPKSFPEKAYGILDTQVEFRICSAEGKNTIKVGNTIYEGLNKTQKIGAVPEGYDFYAGSTYHGMFVFQMVKKYNKYLIKPQNDVGEKTKIYINPQK